MPAQYTGGRWLGPGHKGTETAGEAGDVGRVQPPRPLAVDLTLARRCPLSDLQQGVWTCQKAPSAVAWRMGCRHAGRGCEHNSSKKGGGFPVVTQAREPGPSSSSLRLYILGPNRSLKQWGAAGGQDRGVPDDQTPMGTPHRRAGQGLTLASARCSAARGKTRREAKIQERGKPP